MTRNVTSKLIRLYPTQGHRTLLMLLNSLTLQTRFKTIYMKKFPYFRQVNRRPLDKTNCPLTQRDNVIQHYRVAGFRWTCIPRHKSAAHRNVSLLTLLLENITFSSILAVGSTEMLWWACCVSATAAASQTAVLTTSRTHSRGVTQHAKVWRLFWLAAVQACARARQGPDDLSVVLRLFVGFQEFTDIYWLFIWAEFFKIKVFFFCLSCVVFLRFFYSHRTRGKTVWQAKSIFSNFHAQYQISAPLLARMQYV